MTRYILSNTQYLYSQGVRVSAFMTEDQQQQLRVLKDKQREERSQGRHAIIRNMSLIVNGKDENYNTPSAVNTPKSQDRVKENLEPTPSSSSYSTPNSNEPRQTATSRANTSKEDLPEKANSKAMKIIPPKQKRATRECNISKPNKTFR